MARFSAAAALQKEHAMHRLPAGCEDKEMKVFKKII